MSENLPPTDANPGDTWGAYVLCEDGWWRLNESLSHRGENSVDAER
jgi:hypothetical protein